ncbi:MAG: hydrogenase 4 subunit F [Bacteroidales bacterium]|nr:hydrogenase 4 subunit F [Bacteroidales bacterium]
MGLFAFFAFSVLLAILSLLVRNKFMTRIFMLLFSATQIILTVYAWKNIGKTELIYFTFNYVGVLLMSVLAFLILPVAYHGFIYVTDDDTRKYSIYHLSLIALITFMTGAYLANNMTVLWIFVEATTLAVAALIYHDRTEIALEATWKYVFICSTGIALAYLGILFLGFIYGRDDAASLSFEDLSGMINRVNPLYLKIAFLFVLVGFSTKMGLFPMHTVTIDAHSVAPPPISALISTTLMNVGFIAIFRVYTLFASSPILGFMNNALILSGVLSLLIAAGYMLKAKHIKRMLAYSSLENMGLVAIALGIGGHAYYGALLLLVLHSLVKSGLFFQMGQLHRVLHTFKLDESGKYMNAYPAGALVLITGMILILAFPPSGMFLAEFFIFKGMIFQGRWILAVIVMVLISFIIYAMSTRILHIVYSEPKEYTMQLPPGKVNPAETITQFLFFAVVIVLCFVQPPFLAEIINKSFFMLPN